MDDILYDLHRDRVAASGTGVQQSLVNTWKTFHGAARESTGGVLKGEFIPLTPSSIELVAAFFKSGGYRSFPNYLSAVKQIHVESGYAWTDQLDLAGRWTTRSVLRGIGPARQSRALKLKELMKMPPEDEPLVPGGPRWPMEALQLGCMFLLRETELAAARIHDLSFDHEATEVTWKLTASKSDPMALGTTRSWGCLCGLETLPCPYHLAARVTQKALAWAEERWSSTRETSQAMPLFPNNANTAVSKVHFVETIEAIAVRLGEPLQDKDGLRLYGGHTVRVTGAQSLAAHGIEIAKIRILARHSGDTILRYVAEAPLKTLRADLGLVEPSSTTTRGAATPKTKVDKQIKKAMARIDEQGKQLKAMLKGSNDTKAICYAQNVTSLVCHALRAGDASHTACGWSVGAVMQRKRGIHFMNDVRHINWKSMCDRCMIPERQAARLLEPASTAHSDPE